MSRKYSGFYPSASLDYEKNDWQLSLSYRYETVRPSYFMLRGSFNMNTVYNYEGGNPTLQPKRCHRFSFSAGWKDLSLGVDYQIVRDGCQFVMDHYLGVDSIYIFHPVNMNYRHVNVTLTYNPTFFKIWKPSLTLSMDKNWLTYGGLNYNKPGFYCELDHVVELPKSWTLGMDMYAQSKGYYGGVMKKDYDFNLDFYVLKSFIKNKWNVRFDVTNLLNSERECWTLNTNGYDYRKWNDSCRRTFSLSVSYQFNQSKNKYRGEIASDEIKRL